MEIVLKDVAKRFNREILFESLNYTFKSGESTAIVGPNGSGKSTLLQLIAGNQLPSSGEISYNDNGSNIPVEDIFNHISFAAPYLELIEEFTLLEQIQFHFKFKPIRSGETINSLIEYSFFDDHKHKFIKNFSSGMKQRLKLALAFFSNTEILLLDEPTTNLDKKGSEWFFSELNKMDGSRLLILASNQEIEYKNCHSMLNLADFKVC
ncbi:ABC transporter ATP-binding protein [Fulvivirga lutea]|uniref:ABC transporter ATP-binding protein n=1 Tax=Fulvivirga lutea TaxID=2810512 RepID=A0A974WMN8_9BACT|nr:ABC transporter ATP-binding protein [Fulvivirga lutea]QSE99095.1 ABC transporter ATP-binding protein [Fulvivirga lutea]